MAAEFTCEDCGAWVVNSSLEEPPIPQVCFTCLWLRTVEEKDRAAIQERLQAIAEGRAP